VSGTKWVRAPVISACPTLPTDDGQPVIATKYTTNFRAGHNKDNIMVNFTGNGSKSLHLSVEASLKKLQTDYIDLVSSYALSFAR
jgi:aryl-alcohol dehydrogenase-like predicted oxidoreductase